jgi:hypothetical protein
LLGAARGCGRRRLLRAGVHTGAAVAGVLSQYIFGVVDQGEANAGEDEVDCQDDELDDPERDEVAFVSHFGGGRHCDV